MAAAPSGARRHSLEGDGAVMGTLARAAQLVYARQWVRVLDDGIGFDEPDEPDEKALSAAGAVACGPVLLHASGDLSGCATSLLCTQAFLIITTYRSSEAIVD